MRKGARGHYAYPIAEHDLPVVRIGVDPMPTSCSHCGSTLLSRHPPTGADRYGVISCVLCGRELCRTTPEPRAFRWPALTGVSSLESRVSSSGPQAPKLETRNSKPEGCAAGCSGAAHDPQSHEDYGRQSLLTDILARPWAYGLPSVKQVVAGPLTVDLAQQRASLDGRLVDTLSPTEWRILACLARRQGRVVEQIDIIEDVWGTTQRRLDEAAPASSRPSHKLRIAMARLRARLGAAGALITTNPGLGYMLAEDDRGGSIRPIPAAVPRVRRAAGVPTDAERQGGADQPADGREPLLRLPAETTLEEGPGAGEETSHGPINETGTDPGDLPGRRRGARPTTENEGLL